MSTRRAMLIAALSLSGCAGDDGPPLEVNNVTIYAPLPGSRAAVAYLDFANHSNADIVVTDIQSPSFGSVEFHESRLDAGVASMQPVASLVVPAGRTVTLAPRRMHLMLLDPVNAPAVGDAISLRIRYDAAGEILVRATLQSRVRLDSN
jgi:copper(I)-binding protein